MINERQEVLLMNAMLKEASDEYVEELGPKRLELKRFLDSNFRKGSIDKIGEDGTCCDDEGRKAFEEHGRQDAFLLYTVTQKVQKYGSKE